MLFKCLIFFGSGGPVGQSNPLVLQRGIGHSEHLEVCERDVVDQAQEQLELETVYLRVG